MRARARCARPRSSARAAARAGCAARPAPSPRPRRDSAVGEGQRALPPAGQFAIDLDQNLGVEQRAVLHPLRPVDAIAVAQGVEAVGRAGMLAPRQRERVDHALARRSARRPSAASSALRKRMSNSALWMTSRSSPMKARNSSTTAANTGLSASKVGRVAVDARGVLRHVALGIDEDMEMRPGRRSD